ncbi:MAG: RraA family protein [Alphaproteobacteria bacterium]|nr:RraA family protein [Alphaproteobacteria bacterium]
MTPRDIAETLGRFPTATIYEAAGKCGDMSPDIRPIVPGAGFSGIAYTVRTFPSDTTAVIRALDDAPAGSVLVIDAGGTDRAAVWGGTSSLVCSMRGLVGCVTNGCVRDIDGLLEAGIAVYAAGIAPRGTLKNHEGWRGIPVAVGGVTVSPGDYVIGDRDGVIVVAAADGAAMCERAQEQRIKEEARDERVRKGESLASIIGLDSAEG